MADRYQIYVVRHAIAEERGEAYPDDGLRPLTARGAAKFRKVASGLAAMNVSIDRILSSPLVRARQTADILAEELGDHPQVTEIPALEPDGTFDALGAALEDFRRFHSIALVGHEPSIGLLGARLIGSRTPLEFKKGGVCRVDLDALPPSGTGRLRWFAPPRLLAALGR
jgi:phosphohistidine phosphatase